MSPVVVAVVQARMASSRLPGKVLLDIAGRPMLARVLARVARAESVNHLLVATTTDVSDDPVESFCSSSYVPCFRGSQFDVLDRYYQAVRSAHADVVVRITADCPVIDPALIDEAVHALAGHIPGAAHPESEPKHRPFAFVANRLPPPYGRSFPIGLDVEVCTFKALERAWKEGREPHHREHVMPYLYEGVDLHDVSPQFAMGKSAHGFQVGQCNHVPDVGTYRWTVDTPEDLEFMREAYARFGGNDDFSWKQLLHLVLSEPELSQINAGIRHKTLRDVDERAAKH